MTYAHSRHSLGFAISCALFSAPSLTFAQQAQTPPPAVTIEPESIAPINVEPVPVVLAPIVVPQSPIQASPQTAEGNAPATPSTTVLDHDVVAIRPSNAPIVEDLVVTNRFNRVGLATLAATGTLVGVDLLITLGVVFGFSGGSPTVPIISIVGGAGLVVFAVPAVYYAVSGAMGGNGSYWVTVGGQALGLVAGGALAGVGIVSRHPAIIGVFSLLGAAALLSSWGIAYELSTTERHPPRDTPQRSTARATFFPGLLLNETQRGLTLGGVF